MRILKQETYFPLITGIHFIMWAIDLYFYEGSYELTPQRILGEVFSSWVVIAFAINFLMASRLRWVERLFGGLDKMYFIHRRAGSLAVILLLLHFITVPKTMEINAGKGLGLIALVLILIVFVLLSNKFG